MKTEAQIRAHRDALRSVMARPCTCPGPVHEPACTQRVRFASAADVALSWALGEFTGPSLLDLIVREAREPLAVGST